MFCSRCLSTLGLVVVLSPTVSALAEDGRKSPAPAVEAAPPIEWLQDYSESMRAAQANDKMLFLYFQGDASQEATQRFEKVALADSRVRQQLSENFLTARLPLDATIIHQGKELRLLEHGAFAELNGRPGAVIIDFAHRDTEYYGYVVSVFPLTDGRYYKFHPKNLSVLLDLPAGTLTQRTMVFAVRIHPEGPQSTVGAADMTLMDEARSHSRHQAQIRVQGHHNWDTRFGRITGRLGGGLRAQEVVAESWPHQGLLDAAVDCVASWRQSSGHWRAVRSFQNRFGYDMRRGSNGIWYATGIFGNRR